MENGLGEVFNVVDIEDVNCPECNRVAGLFREEYGQRFPDAGLEEVQQYMEREMVFRLWVYGTGHVH